ncbi:unnamed protein product [Meloidogyne enterolobii]|uniref:Uncharacterized protein n=1 Tax=Meloidogyne enterolobii TaxID=390850 RepID=A0ACB0XV10_MELEN
MSKVYRSLFLIVLVNMGSYTFGIIMFKLFKILTTLNFISFNLLNFTIFGTIGGTFINFGSTSNAPILYINRLIIHRNKNDSGYFLILKDLTYNTGPYHYSFDLKISSIL